MTAERVRHFAEAAHAFADQVAAVPADRWDGPGLGVWDLRALIGHTSRSLITVRDYLGKPAERVDLESPEAYYGAVAAILRAETGSTAVVERGVAAGRALGEDPVATVAALVDQVVPLTVREDDPVITTLVGGMRLSEYLPTRVFELVVHGLDIAAALDVQPPAWSTDLLAGTLATAARAAAVEGTGITLLRALTGRGTLPVGYSIL